MGPLSGVSGSFSAVFSHFEPNFSRKSTSLDFSDLLNIAIMSNIPIRGKIVKRNTAVKVSLLPLGPVIRHQSATDTILAQNGSNQAEDGTNEYCSNLTVHLHSIYTDMCKR